MGIAMPPAKKSAVCISFDFDCVSYWFGMAKSFGSQGIGRGEYGARVGAERLLALLDKYGVESTWFTPGHTAETWPRVTRAIAEAGHEIAHHGYCHEPPPELGEREESILVRGIEALESVAGRRPVGYRAPSWEITERTIPLLLEHGFTYASNGMAQDFQPYLARVGDVASVDRAFAFGEESRLIEIPSSHHLADGHLELGSPGRTPSPSETERVWRDEFDYMHANIDRGVITYVFHPEAAGRGYRMMMLERLLEHMRDCGDVWFARMRDIADAWQPDPPGEPLGET